MTTRRRPSPLPLAAALLLSPLAAPCLTAFAQTPPAPAPAQSTAPAAAPKGPARWEKNIAAFEAKDREKAAPKNAVLFVGSSSIVGWRTLDRDFPAVPTLNRGFGGSVIADSVHFADRIVVPYRPRAVVFYAGDNDVKGGRTPEQVLSDFQAFVKKLRDGGLADTTVHFLAIKPSLARWNLWDRMRKANSLVRDWAATQGGKVVFVDVATPMLGADGRPRPELFLKDGLHMKPEGYRVWTEVLAPYLAGYRISPSGR